MQSKEQALGGRYIDPLNSIQMKRAKVKSMTTHDSITEDNNLKLRYKMKKRIRLTEGDLHSIIRQQVRNILRESVDFVSPQPFDGDSSCVGQEDTAFMDEIRPFRLQSRDLSAIGFLNKMRDRVDTARYRKDGMQGLLDDLEELIDACEEKVRKEANY